MLADQTSTGDDERSFCCYWHVAAWCDDRVIISRLFDTLSPSPISRLVPRSCLILKCLIVDNKERLTVIRLHDGTNQGQDRNELAGVIVIDLEKWNRRWSVL